MPTNTERKHRIEIEMKSGAKSAMNLVEAGTGKCHSLIEPVISLENGNFVWNQIQGETYYYLWDGKTSTEVNSPLAIDQSQFGNYHIYAVDKKGFESGK